MSMRTKLTPKLPKNRIRRFLVVSATATLGYFVGLSLWLALVKPTAFGPVLLGFLAGALFATVLCAVIGSVVAAQLWVFAPDLAEEDSPARKRWQRLAEAVSERLAEPQEAERPEPERAEAPAPALAPQAQLVSAERSEAERPAVSEQQAAPALESASREAEDAVESLEEAFAR